MSVYKGDFDETKYMSFSIKKMMNGYEDIIKFGTKSARLLKRDLIVSPYIMKTI